jgi:hypothetical protein
MLGQSSLQCGYVLKFLYDLLMRIPKFLPINLFNILLNFVLSGRLAVECWESWFVADAFNRLCSAPKWLVQ